MVDIFNEHIKVSKVLKDQNLLFKEIAIQDKNVDETNAINFENSIVLVGFVSKIVNIRVAKEKKEDENSRVNSRENRRNHCIFRKRYEIKII